MTDPCKLEVNKEATGKVGAFWILPNYTVIGEACLLSKAEKQAEFYNGLASHNDLWPKLAKPINLLGRTYTTVPRGRVIYNSTTSCFVIFAAPEILIAKKAKDAVERFYDLKKTEVCIIWKDDSHYETQLDLIDEMDDF